MKHLCPEWIVPLPQRLRSHQFSCPDCRFQAAPGTCAYHPGALRSLGAYLRHCGHRHFVERPASVTGALSTESMMFNWEPVTPRSLVQRSAKVCPRLWCPVMAAPGSVLHSQGTCLGGHFLVPSSQPQQREASSEYIL